MEHILENLERDGAHKARERARTMDPPKNRHVFFVSLFITPFLVVEAMFVPLLGQALVLLAAFMSVSYLWYIGSWRGSFSALAGCILSLVLLIVIPVAAKGLLGPLGYFILGTATFLSIAYIVGIGILIFQRLNP